MTAKTVHKNLGLSEISWRSSLGVTKTVLIARFKIVLRYKGAIVFDMILPVILASLPILLGVAIAGQAAAQNFEDATGTENYKLYMLIGASTFIVVTLMLWLVGYWIRREMETGTLESVYASPAKRVEVLSGVTLYALIRSLMAFAFAMVVGSLIFQVDLFQGEMALALVFVVIGIIPLWGISFAFGALILKVKEADSLIQVMQWVVAFFMGIFFPITVFPPFLRYVALSFPPTWMTNGVRASLLDVAYFFGTWYFDLAVLLAFAAVLPLVGYTVFLRTESRIKKNEGVGQF
ncbi:MAG: ABC transporter permease [Candidatus Thermoplasmatota archaeon]|nr:ABC transporter permease [Candidatus Thermoplasmatota archaeon]